MAKNKTLVEDEKHEEKQEEYVSVSSSARRKKGKGSGVFKPLAVFAGFCFAVYSIFTIISQQVEITQLKQEKSEINEQITEAKQINDEYTRLLSSDDEEAYMERIAVEKLGYAYPNERRFYIVDKQ